MASLSVTTIYVDPSWLGPSLGSAASPSLSFCWNTEWVLDLHDSKKRPNSHGIPSLGASRSSASVADVLVGSCACTPMRLLARTDSSREHLCCWMLTRRAMTRTKTWAVSLFLFNYATPQQLLSARKRDGMYETTRATANSEQSKNVK
jgi:hypothetical protein